MKSIYFFLFFALVLLPYNILGQSTVFKTLEEVDTHPAFPGCDDMSFGFCSAPKITIFVQENADKELVDNLDPAGVRVSLKLILDDTGKVRRVFAYGEDELVNNEVARVAKELPQFSPALFKGETVNTVLEIPILLKPKEEYDSLPILERCRNKKDPKKCTSMYIQEFFSEKFKMPKLEMEEGFVNAAFNIWIDENGKISDIKAFGPEEVFNEASIVVLKGLPPFIPATKDGENVEYLFTFRLMMAYRK